MPNLFWVGGTAAWDGTAGTKWALTSGGAGGQPIPTATDDVFFDSGGAGTVTISAGNTGAKSIDCTTFTGTLAGSAAITISGGLKLVVGQGFTYTGTITFAGTGTLTSAGKTIPAITLNTAGIVITAGDAITCSGALTTTRGKFDVGGFNCSFFSYVGTSAFAKALDISNTTFTLTGIGTVWNTVTANGTFTVTNSTVKINTASGSNARVFTTGGVTLNNIWWTGNNSGNITMTSTSTFADFKDDISVAHTLRFTAGTTTTVTTFTVNGGPGRMITMQSTTGGSAWTVSDSTGTNTADYVSIQDSTATGGATFNAIDAINVSGNTGWNFTAKRDSMFLMFM